MHIVFLTTGGTIDKDYPHTTGGWAFEFGDESAVERLLQQRLSFPEPSFSYEIQSICQKDSLEMTDGDREALWRAIVRHRVKGGQEGVGFVITHGTDTLLESALYLQRKLDDQTATPEWSSPPRIVLTGAMRPERFSNSDAPLNVGMALSAVQLLPTNGQSAVHVCMHGIVKAASDMKRDTVTGRFC